MSHPIIEMYPRTKISMKEKLFKIYENIKRGFNSNKIILE